MSRAQTFFAMHATLTLVLLLPLDSQAQQSYQVVSITNSDTLKARCGALGIYEQVTVRISGIHRKAGIHHGIHEKAGCQHAGCQHGCHEKGKLARRGAAG